MKEKSFKFYSVVIVAFCFMVFYFGCFFLNNCINIVLPFVEGAYEWSRGTVNAVVTVAGLISIAGGFLTVSCVMKIGLKKTMAIMMGLAGIFSIIMGYTQVFSLFALALAILQIVASAAFMVLPGFLLANWFVKKRGMMMGIATVGVPVSGTTCNTIVSMVMESHSFALAFAGVGVIVLILALLSFVVVVERPEDVGLAPDGVPLTPEEVAENQKMLAESANAMSIKKMLHLKETWIYIAAFGLLAMMMTGIISQLVPRLMDAGYDSATATQLFALNALIGIPVSFIWGWLVDKTSVRTASIVLCGCFGASAILILIANADNLFITVLAMAAVGTLQGGLPNLETSMIAYIFGRVHFANANRILRAGVGVFRSLGYSAMGLAYTYTQSYDISYMIFIAAAILAAGLILTVKGCYDSESPRYNKQDVMAVK